MKICPVCSTEYPDDVKFCPNDGQTLRSAGQSNDLVGQVVADRYHVVKKLGEGGMGQVYLAEHVKMGRRSAIKVMNPSLVHDSDAVARFNREASNASRITHPNVCAIYDFGETSDGLIYLAMEFIEGEPLTDLLEREGAISLTRATGILLQTADALQAAHDLGIVHRDLKPDNIMLTKARDGRDTVKVVDFGIAKAVGGDAAGQKVTKTGLVIGTPEFMSPEQLSGDTLDGRSDLYSLALVFYRMLSGKLPFEATTVQETMVKRLTDDPIKLSDARPDLSFPAGLQSVFDTALARRPAERYQSVAKFAAAVAALAGRPVPHSVPATEAKTQLLDPVAATPTTRASAKQPPPGASRRKSFVPLGAALVIVVIGGAAWMVLSGGKRTNGAVARDTARTASRIDSVARGGREGIRTPPAPPAPPPAAVNVGRARDALDDLFLEKLTPATAQMVRDSALRFFTAGGISDKDKAYAAFVVGQAYFQMRDRPTGCRYIRTANGLDPADNTYTALLGQCAT